MKLMGLGKEDYQMFEALYWDVSDISMKNNLYENYNFHVNPDIQSTRTKIHLWCGEKEPYAIKSHKILKKYLKNYEEIIFENMGHGQMLMKKNEEYMEILRQTFAKAQ